jgi:hypothetical protein
MTDRFTRREFLRRSGMLAASASALPLVYPNSALAQDSRAGEDLPSEELVDAGESFRRGNANGARADGAAVRATRDKGVFTSRVLQSSTSFTHVGLHWSASVPSGSALDFELRTSEDGSTWSSWSTAYLKRLPEENPVGDYFASLVYASEARYVQYRATFGTGGGASPTLKRVTATVIDSQPMTTTSSTTVTDQPVVVNDPDSGRTLNVTSREQWGANEKYRFSKRGQELWPEMFVPAKKLVVHHTATRNDYKDAAEAAAEVRAIYYYHAVTQRYGDIGYTALIDRFGNVYEGRHGRGEGAGREVLSAGVVAGHDYAHNYGSAGVALLGDATQAGWQMTPDSDDPMWGALVHLGVFEAGRHYLRPLKADGSTPEASDFLRSDNVWTDNMRNVSGHRETNSTACPGPKVMELLDELQAGVHEGLSDTSPTGVTLTNTSPGGRQTTVGKPLTYTWAAEDHSGWTLVGYEYCFEGWYKPSRSNNITYLKGYTSEAQPRPKYERVGPETTSMTFRPDKVGQYTLHVRAVLQDSSGAQRRSAYEGRHTFLVK